ncbi:hypothetical protein CEP51_016813, partial [Fusarium floridanum]
MPPKKKGNKKNQQDDWEAQLGESIAPPAADNDAPAGDDNADGDDDAGAGGLMATLRKNKEKRKKKGIVGTAPVEEETLAQEPVNKAPEEATMDDEFDLPQKKGKGGKHNKQHAKQAEPVADDGAESGRILTKAEKEKLKKEREKQRKKEQ